MLDRCETLRDCRTTITQSSLKISTLHTIYCGFYRSPSTVQCQIFGAQYFRNFHNKKAITKIFLRIFKYSSVAINQKNSLWLLHHCQLCYPSQLLLQCRESARKQLQFMRMVNVMVAQCHCVWKSACVVSCVTNLAMQQLLRSYVLATRCVAIVAYMQLGAWPTQPQLYMCDGTV